MVDPAAEVVRDIELLGRPSPMGLIVRMGTVYFVAMDSSLIASGLVIDAGENGTKLEPPSSE